MHPELFEIPFVHATVKSYGLMLVIGLLIAIFVIRKLSERIGMSSVNKDNITNGALYALIAGVIGSRVFYVSHHYNQFRGNMWSVFSIWEGGLELLGGVVLAVSVIFAYLLVLKLPIRRYLDVIAIGIVFVLAFGRIGCFLNGCCWGAPANVSWAVQYPYNSLPYISQAFPDIKRDRSEPYIQLPDSFYGEIDKNGTWQNADPDFKYYYTRELKPLSLMTPDEKEAVTHGKYCALKIHPTQLYSSAGAFALGGILFTFWLFAGYGKDGKIPRLRIGKPGCTFALMLMLYSIGRFLIEFIRDDNPFEYMHFTISQLISVGLFVFGAALFTLFVFMKSDDITRTALISKPHERSTAA